MNRLTMFQAQVLGVIADGGLKSVSDIAADLLVSDSKARSTINALERRGLLARNYTAATTHSFLVGATKAGEAEVATHFGEGCYQCDGFGVMDGLEPCPANCEKSRQVLGDLSDE